jgi:cytidylate kinase
VSGSGYNSRMPSLSAKNTPPPALSVAIDGPAGAGKSTVAREVARALDLIYVDTGAMYRAVAWAVLERGVPPDDADAVTAVAEQIDIELRPGRDSREGTRVFVDGVEITGLIRTPSISNLTSPLSAIPGVRRRLVALQKQMGAAGGVVMEGRDIGTVVMPDAPVKVFLTASLERRAERRRSELAERGLAVSYDALLQQIAERDKRDSSRDVAPMVPARDSIQLDTDHLTADQVVRRILDLCEAAAALDVLRSPMLIREDLPRDAVIARPREATTTHA